MSLRISLLTVLSLIATLALAGCKHITTVVILATEYEFGPSTIEARTGQIRIDLRNVGNSSHALRIVGQQEKVVVVPGERKVFQVTLAPGSYQFICPLNDHDSLGMIGTLIVRP